MSQTRRDFLKKLTAFTALATLAPAQLLDVFAKPQPGNPLQTTPDVSLAVRSSAAQAFPYEWKSDTQPVVLQEPPHDWLLELANSALKRTTQDIGATCSQALLQTRELEEVMTDLQIIGWRHA